MLQLLDKGKCDEKKESQKFCYVTKNNLTVPLHSPATPTRIEPPTRAPSWQLVSPQLPWRVQLPRGSNPEYSLLGHTSSLPLPFRASSHTWRRSVAAAPSNINTFSLLGWRCQCRTNTRHCFPKFRALQVTCTFQAPSSAH